MSKLQYVDWQVTLIAPPAFLKVSLSLAAHFDFAISRKDIGDFVPEFEHAWRPPACFCSLED